MNCVVIGDCRETKTVGKRSIITAIAWRHFTESERDHTILTEEAVIDSWSAVCAQAVRKVTAGTQSNGHIVVSFSIHTLGKMT